MSNVVDSRVVEMRFDNQHFEKNVSTTMSTLDKLKQSLNLNGATKGLENIDSTARKMNFYGLNNAVETVQAKFSALQVIGVTALMNITNSAVNAGKRIVSALTIDPIKTGFQEYETQINAVQTILANTQSKGTTLQDVNRALDTLNTYADKTIYNFTEMTRNIGTFTAAGVDLDKSVSAIQGIANLAAVSGSTSQQASNAMYQLSQALAAGRVSLMDWNSVVNAGMGGQVFQDALKRTAKNMGIVVDESKSFRESIQGSDTWLSSDVLIKTLEQFTMAAEEGSKEWDAFKKSLMDDGYTEAQAVEILKMANTATDAATKVKTFTQLWDTLKESAQSGWTQTWEILIGDFGEAKETLTEVSDVIGKIIGDSAEMRNKLLKEGLSSGWKQLLDAGIADEEGYKDSITAIAKEHGIAFDEMVKKGEEAGKSFEEVLSESLKSGEMTPEILTKSVTHLADSMRKMSEEEFKAAGYTQEYLAEIEKLEAGLKDGSISMDDFVTKMTRLSGRQNIIQGLWNVFNGLLSVIEPIKQAFRDIFPSLKGEQIYELTEKFRLFTEKLKVIPSTAEKLSPTFENIKRTFKGVFALMHIGVRAISALWTGFTKLVGYVMPATGGILGFTASIGDYLVALDEAIGKSDFFNKAIEKIGNFLKRIGDGVKEFAKSFSDSFGDVASNAKVRLEPLAILGGFIKSIFVGLAGLLGKLMPTLSKLAKGLGEAFGTLADGIADSIQNADYNKLFDIFNGGVFAAIGVYIAKFMKSVSDIVSEGGGFVENIQELLGGVGDALNAFTGSLKAETLKKIATAIGILAASLFMLSIIDSEKLGGALGAITVLFVELCGALSIFTKLAGGKGFAKIPAVAAALVSLSISLLILSAALKILGTMSWDEMGVGLTGLTFGLGALIGAVWLLPDGKFKKAAKAIRSLSTSLIIFAVALKILGSMSWDELAVGLTATVIGLGALVGALWLLPKDMRGKAAGMMALSTAMVILGAALKIMASMSWGEIAKGLVTLAGSLLIICLAMKLMPSAVGGAFALLVISSSLVILSGALKIMSTMSWDEIARGLTTLAGSLIIISTAMALMKHVISGAAALLVVSAALMVLTPVLKILGGMSWSEIAHGLTMLAGTFTVIGLAGLLLGPLVPTILALAGALTLLGISCVAIGAGVLMVGLGMTALAGALATGGAAITLFISSIIGLIPYLIEQIGVGIIKVCEVISGSAAAICEALTVIITALVEAVVTCAPAIAEGIFVLIDELLGLLVNYTPKIVSSLFDLLIGIINALSEKIPDLVQAGVNLLAKLFEGVIAAMNEIDTGTLVNGILAVGVLTALVMALAGIAAMAPAAMVGVLGLGVIIGELTLVLAAIGALAQIPGLEWLVSEGGNFMQTIGNAIGQFVGGIVGGFGAGVTASLPQIGTNLSDFMKNIKPFIDGAKTVDGSMLEGVKSLVGAVIAITAADVVNSLASFITGGSSLSEFGEQLIPFGESMKAYGQSVAGIDAGSILASAAAAKALTTVVEAIPNSGGLVGLFAGENDISSFGEQLVPFGESLKAYSLAVAGIDSQAIVGSAIAAKALTEMADNVPNEGGIVSWFTGENSIAKFGGELIALGMGLKGFAIATTGIVPETIVGVSNAAKALADMMSVIPNEGGLVAWLTGENSVSRFGEDLIRLGFGLKGFALATTGIMPETIIATAGAAKALADMMSVIPNEGGLVAWLTGENSVSNFASQLVDLGFGLASFSTATAGIIPENIIGAANAAKSIAEMASVIPNEGGIAAWFVGENSIASFASQLPLLGMGLNMFSMSVAGIVPENMIAAANAAKSIAEMTTYIPNEGGMKSWFVGENSLATFSDKLPALGEGLAGFSEAVVNIDSEKVTAAAGAAKALAEMTAVIPNEGGIKAWFTGETSIANFADKLPSLGEGLAGFSESVADINPENITAAADAAKSLGQMAETTPKDTDNIITFGENLVTFGDKLKGYFDKVGDITAESLSSSSNAIKSMKEATSSLDGSSIKSASDAISDMVTAVKKLSSVNESSVSGFNSAMKKLAETNVDSIVKAFDNAGPKMTTAGKTLLENFVTGAAKVSPSIKKAGETAITRFTEGIKAKENAAKKACESVLKKCVNALKGSKNSFYNAGAAVVTGFAAGISDNSFKAAAKAKAMANAAEKAAKEALDINSPSKVFRRIGMSIPEGFAQGIDRLGNVVKAASVGMSDTALDGVKGAISKVADAVNTDIDSQPTIRPVLDLSDIKSGAGAINSMLGITPSIHTLATVGSISTMMNRNQNGVNADVVSAIDKLRSDLSNIGGNSYTIGGITYDDGSAVSDAIKTLIRVVNMERRV